MVFKKIIHFLVMTYNAFTWDIEKEKITVANISDVELWELFTGRQVTHDERMELQHPDYDSDSPINKGFPVKWNELIGIKNIVANVTLSITDYMLLLLWIREVKFEMPALLIEQDLKNFIRGAYIFRGIEKCNKEIGKNIIKQLHAGHLKDRNGISSPSGFTTVYCLTSLGKQVGKRKFNEQESPTTAIVFPASVIAANDVKPVSDCEKHETAITPSKRTKAQITPSVGDIADYLTMTQAASGRGNPVTAVEAAYNESIERAEEPAEVIVKNEKPIITSESPDSPIVQAIEKATATLQEILQRPLGFYYADRQKPFTQEDIPDESKGFFLSQNDYAKRQKCRVGTLKKYRETDNGATTISANGVQWIKDKVGNLLRRVGNKRNSSYEYFVKSE